MQISEGRWTIWRVGLLVALCIGSVIVRWAGLLTWLTVGAVLLRGEFWPQLNKRWALAFTTGALTLLTFFIIRTALTVPPDVQKKIREFGGMSEGTEQPIVATADPTVAAKPPIFNPTDAGIKGLIGRAKNWGNWFSYLLWQPFRLGASNAAVGVVALLVGWAVLVPLLVMLGVSFIRREWIWLALLIYSFALAMNWPHPNARYLVPIAPLLILGVFKGMDVIKQHYRSARVTMTSNVLLGYFVATLVLCNGALYACDACVARSNDFYNSYEAGLNRDLIYAAHWFNKHPPLDGQIAVCERYINLGRARISRLGLRSTTMLTGKAIVSVPFRYLKRGDPRNSTAFLAWCRSPEIGVKYYLYQPEVSPWRLFHFRVPWLQEAMSDAPATNTGAGWRLYEIPPEGSEAKRVSVGAAPGWPTRVPGL
jgi:hypothetical protein